MLAVGDTGNASLNNNWADTFTDPQMGSFLVCTTSAQATTEPSTIQLLGCGVAAIAAGRLRGPATPRY